ncbi:hypothetical protein [Sporisorium scitamineum]|uniref:Uncharacterized protein n=1 Tax=Sporisorium scitamineum TaxID=49012 RepID=A0A0F7RU47_9BASI|nr:hypothetical protein [Sporisorium scitamineum]
MGDETNRVKTLNANASMEEGEAPSNSTSNPQEVPSAVSTLTPNSTAPAPTQTQSQALDSPASTTVADSTTQASQALTPDQARGVGDSGDRIRALVNAGGGDITNSSSQPDRQANTQRPSAFLQLPTFIPLDQYAQGSDQDPLLGSRYFGHRDPNEDVASSNNISSSQPDQQQRTHAASEEEEGPRFIGVWADENRWKHHSEPLTRGEQQESRVAGSHQVDGRNGQHGHFDSYNRNGAPGINNDRQDNGTTTQTADQNDDSNQDTQPLGRQAFLETARALEPTQARAEAESIQVTHSRFNKEAFEEDEEDEALDDEVNVPTTTGFKNRNTPLYRPCMWYCKDPEKAWPFSDLPDPQREDAVGRSTVRYRYEGSIKNPSQAELVTMRIDAVRQIQSWFSNLKIDLKGGDFAVQVPRPRGIRGTLFMDVKVINADIYENLKLTPLGYAGAPLKESERVFRINGLKTDCNLPSFLKLFRQRYRNVKVTTFWGLYYNESIEPEPSDRDFSGIVFIVGECAPILRTRLDRNIDLTKIGGRVVPVYYEGRERDCDRCNQRGSVRHSISECRSIR